MGITNVRGAFRFALVASVAAGLSGCATVPVDNSHELTRSVWQLQEVITEGGAKHLNAAQSETHTLEFYENGDMALDLPTTTNYELSRNGRTLRVNARRVSYVFSAR